MWHGKREFVAVGICFDDARVLSDVTGQHLKKVQFLAQRFNFEGS